MTGSFTGIKILGESQTFAEYKVFWRSVIIRLPVEVSFDKILLFNANSRISLYSGLYEIFFKVGCGKRTLERRRSESELLTVTHYP